MNLREPRFSLASILLLAAISGWPAPADERFTFPVQSNLRAAVAKIDISPPSGTPATGHVRPTNGFRDRLHAVILLLDDSRTKAAIVTHDLIASTPAVTEGFRSAVSEAVGIPADHILVAASHNHSGPKWEALPEWNRNVVAEVTKAVQEAANQLRPVTLGYSEDRIDFGINRRQNIGGRNVVRLNPHGPNDPRVKVLRVDDGRSLEPVAVLMHAVCHPCVYTWGDKWSEPYPNGYPKLSADFPGEAKSFVEKVYGPDTKALFLQGCAGDIRPNLPGFPYRCGDEADIRWCGRSLGCAAVRAADRTVVREQLAKRPTIYPIKSATKIVELPPYQGETRIRCELQALKVGPFLFLTLPGEPMVEFGFRIEKIIADRAVPFIVGYANGNIGYICTDQAHQEGGYEPSHSATGPGTEAVLIEECVKLADRVIADVFEHFAPTRSKK